MGVGVCVDEGEREIREKYMEETTKEVPLENIDIDPLKIKYEIPSLCNTAPETNKDKRRI